MDIMYPVPRTIESHSVPLSFVKAAELLKQPTFPWTHFRQIFPLGPRIHSEGEYEQLFILALVLVPLQGNCVSNVKKWVIAIDRMRRA